MIKPSYINDNYKESAHFNRGDRLVLGTSGLGGVWGEVNEEESIRVILYALENGVNVLDTSPSYNNAQEYVGKALNEWQGERPFVSTKVGRKKAKKADEVIVDYTPSGLRKSVCKSLELLNLEYIDLLFLHEPQLVPLENMEVIMQTLQDLQNEGVVGKLGIGGNPVDSFWPYVDKKYFDVVSSFLKLDACCLDGLEHDIPKFQKEGLAVYAASSLHMGLLGSRFEEFVQNPPDSEWIRDHHIDNAVKVNKIALENGVTLSNLALRYLFSIQEADRVVLGPSNMEEFKGSLSAWKEGPVEEELFDQITESIIESVTQ